jgi:phosphoribosyl-AMP cyclohydrolase
VFPLGKGDDRGFPGGEERIGERGIPPPPLGKRGAERAREEQPMGSKQEFLDRVEFDSAGYVPAVVQDAENGEVLMVAYLNREAVERTLETGKIHYYSRSRKQFWVKGETSGHTQELVEARVDCDMDCILFKVRQKVAACHTGYRSCFYRRLRLEDGSLEVVGKRVFDPEKVYQVGGGEEERRSSPPSPQPSPPERVERE